MFGEARGRVESNVAEQNGTCWIRAGHERGCGRRRGEGDAMAEAGFELGPETDNDRASVRQILSSYVCYVSVRGVG